MPALQPHTQSSSDSTVTLSSLPDDDLVRRVRAGDGACFAVLVRRYNQRLFRTARSIVRDDDEAEDVIQQAYVNAYLHLDQFAERAQFSTWLTRIAIHEAWSRVRRQGRLRQLDPADDEGQRMTLFTSPAQDPEARAYGRELAALMEHAIAALPEMFRTVFMLRDVEGLSTQETAACLGLNEITVKTRLHRARGRLRRTLTATVGASAASAFQFDGARCDRVVATVMTRLEALHVDHAAPRQEDRPS
ncbi:MAG: RNA polymerase sigma factor [Acidobacteria bacterium]|nr:RNA polymerase sigma factor [Acidobacteriota bacterium]